LSAPELAGILDTLSLPVFAADRRGRLIYVNQAACRVLDKPSEAILGASESLFFPPATGLEKHGSERVLSWNGREHVVWVLRDTLHKSVRTTAHTAGHVLDITALRDTELACACSKTAWKSWWST